MVDHPLRYSVVLWCTKKPPVFVKTGFVFKYARGWVAKLRGHGLVCVGVFVVPGQWSRKTLSVIWTTRP